VTQKYPRADGHKRRPIAFSLDIAWVRAGMSTNEDDKAVTSIPLDTEDGRQVVIEQQNVGPRNQVGGGEFKNGPRHRTPEEAAAEQEQLERESPIETDHPTGEEQADENRSNDPPA